MIGATKKALEELEKKRQKRDAANGGALVGLKKSHRMLASMKRPHIHTNSYRSFKIHSKTIPIYF